MDKPNKPKKPVKAKKVVKPASENIEAKKTVEPVAEHPVVAEIPAPIVPIEEHPTKVEEVVDPNESLLAAAEITHDDLINKQVKRRSFIAFGTFTVLSVTAYASWRWLLKSPLEVKSLTAGAHAPLRRALNKNELFFRKLFYSEKHLVRTYPKEMAAKNVRVNSDEGLKTKFDAANWLLQVTKKTGEVLKISLDDIRALPKTEIVFDFKCVEGWDQISHWGGVKFSDFIEHYNLHEEAQMQFCGMETPDKQYYVGLDMPSVMHPQTLLAYEVNDKLLPLNHGAPLRLIIPVKYGIKNLKRIGNITFSNNRPRDYWAELGYDYYSGL